ncbi:hypothetical protein I5G59_gp79 [Mycobacterium phage LilMcDreamy]|uniref:Uncharacterized protein n=1 Tax=Mycobacterium phage LilMcDreamy TaxID=2652422 RepID=A0A5P8D8M8_9CAUD|nr:hypothetical protein I5G59_gp79 [Mycobacterium phage LilMcDreamy]QFP94699.1 hypothetical protein SEA_LILMCDREAMY_79 [Mycobacterium phage LilMcDreamy]
MALGLPKIDLDIGHTVNEFLTLLREMNSKLDTLIEIERDRAGLPTCAECDVKGRLHCRLHGPEGGPPQWPSHPPVAPIDQREGWQR